MRMWRRFLVASILAITAGAIVLAAAVMDIKKATVAPPAVQYLGGIPLPFVGFGSIEFDDEADEWVIGIKMVPTAECQHLAWAFDADGQKPDDGVFAQGWIIIEKIDGEINLQVMGEDESVIELVFLYSPKLQYGTRFIENDEGYGLDPLRNGGPQLTEDCPGGTCECTGASPPGRGCKACCPAGTRPSCNCVNPPSCRCIERRPKDSADELTISVSDYWHVPAP